MRDAHKNNLPGSPGMQFWKLLVESYEGLLRKVAFVNNNSATQSFTCIVGDPMIQQLPGELANGGGLWILQANLHL